MGTLQPSPEGSYPIIQYRPTWCCHRAGSLRRQISLINRICAAFRGFIKWVVFWCDVEGYVLSVDRTEVLERTTGETRPAIKYSMVGCADELSISVTLEHGEALIWRDQPRGLSVCYHKAPTRAAHSYPKWQRCLQRGRTSRVKWSPAPLEVYMKWNDQQPQGFQSFGWR